MKSVLVKNAVVVTENEAIANAFVLLNEGKIANISTESVDADEVIDLNSATLYPGFIDVHNHGAIGIDTNEATVDQFIAVGEFLARHGVTAWLPTFVPDSDSNYEKQIATLTEFIGIQKGSPVAQVAGVHYEGVFANRQMCGALRPQFFKTFTGTELNELPRLSDHVHFTTYAPEIDGGIDLTAELTKQGWVASIGHTMADIRTLDAAKAAGARHMTHFFNAMTGLHHRDVGVVGWGLSNDDVTFDIIADGVHVNKQVLKLACEHKTPNRVSLISDSVSPAGLGDGDFEIWGEKVSVEEGKTRNERGSIAGSVITMLEAVRTMLSIGFSTVDVAKMASRNPARLLGLETQMGSIAVGKRADLVALDGENRVAFSMIGGNIVRLSSGR